MSLSHIIILSDSDGESVGSSTSHVILSDSRVAVVIVPAIALEISLCTKTTIVSAPTAILDPILNSNPEESPEEDLSEDDSSSDEVSNTAGPLDVQAAPAPPAPHQIIPAPPTLPRMPPILV
nr:hypothetical protein [Tanacetum cinerariifolium]